MNKYCTAQETQPAPYNNCKQSIIFKNCDSLYYNFPWWLSGKKSICQCGDTGDRGLIPGLGSSPEERNGNPLQYSCLGNPGKRSLLGYSPWCCKESDTSDHICMHAAPLKFVYYCTSIIPLFFLIERDIFLTFKKWMDEVRDNQSPPKKIEQF